MKLVIVILLYNTDPTYVKECLDSILSSSFQDFSILIVNDGSSISYPSSLFSNPKIILLTNPSNLGIPLSCNRALDYIRSNLTPDYIVRIDSDDKISPSFLQEEVSFLDSHPDYIAVCCNLQKFGSKDTVIKRPSDWNINSLKESFLQSGYRNLSKTMSGYGFAPSMMFRSSSLSSISCNPKYYVCEDLDLHLQLLKLGKIHSILDNTLYLYRSHSDQITKNTSRMAKINFIHEIVFNHFPEIFPNR